MKGNIHLSDRIAARIVKRAVHGPQGQVRAGVETLSDRELQVLRLLGQGLGPSLIADRLAVSVKTVEAYCARIKEKLHLRDSTELLQEAIRWEHDHAV